MKTIKTKSITAALMVALSSSVYAVDINLYDLDSPQSLEAVKQMHEGISVSGTEKFRVYTHTAIEVEQEILREDPASDGDSYDTFDNEVEFGIGAEIGEHWTGYFEMELDKLADESSRRVRDGKTGDLEVRSAYVDWNDDKARARVGVYRPDLEGKTRLFFREDSTMARYNYTFDGGLRAEVGTAILTEYGDSFSEDRQLTWVTGAINNFYVTQALGQQTGEGAPTLDAADGDDFGDLYNLSAGWKGKLGGVRAQFEFNQQFGEAVTGEKYKGQAVYAELSTKVADHEPHILAAWGSGDDDATDNDVSEFQELASDFRGTKMMLDEGYIENIATSGVGGVVDGRRGIGNVTLMQVGDTFNVNPVWEVLATASYLALTEDNDNGDNYLGTEFNIINRWEVSPIKAARVRLYLDLAYLSAGDAFGPDDLWIVEPGVRVEF